MIEYRVITVRTAGISGTNFEKAAGQLGQKVAEAAREGWRPQGGVAAGQSQFLREPYLFQAMVRGQ